MTFWEKVRCLLPSKRRAQEKEMSEELESIRSMAQPGELGNLTRVAEDARETWTFQWLERFGQDVRYAARSMAHNKAFAALAILSLALGIGANSAIYSFMDSILMRSLPVASPESIVVMKWRSPKSYTSGAKSFSLSTSGGHSDGHGFVGTQFPYAAMKLFQDNESVLSSAFCYFGINSLSVSIDDNAEVVKGQYVSGNYFQSMGVPPAAGRLIADSDDAEGGPSSAVASYRFAERRFGEVSRSVGQTIRVNDKPFTIVGVVPPEFFGAEPGYVPDIYLPIHARPIVEPGFFVDGNQLFLDSRYYWVEIMGRLKPGVSLSQAQAVLAPQFWQFTEATVSTEAQRANLAGLTIEPGGAGLDSLRRQYSKPVYVLMTVVGLILLIACANIANLLLARAVARRREIAVRLSMGSGRMRIIRQLLTESVLLATLGGALGVGLAAWGIRVLTLLLANGRENFTLHATIDWRVLAVTFALSLATGVLFGLAPAIQATRVDVMPTLQETQGSAGRSRPRGRHRLSLSSILIAAQIAISLVLLVAAGLFARTVSKLHSIDLGFAREHILLFKVYPKAAGYADSTVNHFYEEVRGQLERLPGVRSVSFATDSFPSGGGTKAPISIVGEQTPAVAPGAQRPDMAVVYSVGPAFFDAMQLPRLMGRDFSDRDAAEMPKVVIINDRLAKVFHLENPIGRMLSLAFGKPQTYEIVGVVRDAKAFQLTEEYMPVVYFPYLQGTRPAGSITYEVRTAGDPSGQASNVRQIVRTIDPKVAVSDVMTQAEHVDQAISSQIALSRLCSAFAVLALVISCIGLYGTVAFNVARRTGEIGIRMALGAPGGRIVWMILREMCVLGAIGLAIGTPIVLVGSRLVQSFLYGIEPNDPMAIGTAVFVLLFCGLLAAYLPARRASRIDPMVAVRHD